MKKSFYILAVILLVAILVFLLFWFRKDRGRDNIEVPPLSVTGDEMIVPSFMTEAEKSSYSLPANSQVQVLGRDDDGSIMSYKIIRSDDDVITNRSQLRIRE